MRTRFAFALGTIVLCLGCSKGGPDLVAVKGKVLYQGKPVPRATVFFLSSKGGVATGTADEQGQFSLATAGRAGAVVGEHRVTVTALEGQQSSTAPEVGSAEYMARMKSASSKPPKSLIPEKFGKPESSGLKQNVDADASKNDLIVDLGS